MVCKKFTIGECDIIVCTDCAQHHVDFENDVGYISIDSKYLLINKRA